MIDYLSISYLGDAELYIVCVLLYSSDLECMLVSCRVFFNSFSCKNLFHETNK